VLGRLGRAVTAFGWRRALAPWAPSTRFARNGPVSIAYDVVLAFVRRRVAPSPTSDIILFISDLG
jgi:hypothetical protein